MVQAYAEMIKSTLLVTGRVRRDTFWEAFICNMFVVILLVMFAQAFPVLVYLQMAYQVATLVSIATFSIRRMHDTGKSGYFILLNLIPILGSAAYVYLLTAASEKGENSYGHSPYEVYA